MNLLGFYYLKLQLVSKLYLQSGAFTGTLLCCAKFAVKVDASADFKKSLTQKCFAASLSRTSWLLDSTRAILWHLSCSQLLWKNFLSLAKQWRLSTLVALGSHLCFFADDVVLLGSSSSDLHLAPGWFAGDCGGNENLYLQVWGYGSLVTGEWRGRTDRLLWHQKLICIPTLNYSHELCIATKKTPKEISDTSSILRVF